MAVANDKNVQGSGRFYERVLLMRWFAIRSKSGRILMGAKRGFRTLLLLLDRGHFACSQLRREARHSMQQTAGGGNLKSENQALRALPPMIINHKSSQRSRGGDGGRLFISTAAVQPAAVGGDEKGVGYQNHRVSETSFEGEKISRKM